MPIQCKKALVTGGAGFIGSHLVDALLSEGCQVAVLDNLSGGKLANLEHVMDRINFIKNDIRQTDTLKKASRGCDVIFHLAAVVAVQETIQNPVESAMVNDIGTLNVLEAAREMKVGRVVLASSCAVYGDDPQLPKVETMAPKPQSPYAVQKLTGEHYARIYNQLHGLETLSLRFFNVYGPRQEPSSPYSGVISIFMTRAVLKSPPVIFGDGNQSRDFIYVHDVVKALLRAADSGHCGGGVFNVGTGRSVRINQLWDSICALSGQRLNPSYAPARGGDILHSLANIDSAKSLLKFDVDFTLETGLAKTFEWYRKQNSDDRRQITETR